LTGRRRSAWPASAIDELQARLVQAPAPLRSLDPDMPEAVDRLVNRCLEPDPEKRFATTADLVGALNELGDEGQVLPKARRLTPRLIAAVAGLVIAMLAGTALVTQQALQPVVQPEPVSVVIADFDNRTNDPAFDQTLEPMLRRALEEASFISAYDRSRIRPVFGVQPGERLDENAARELAVNQGLGVVLAGFVAPRGNGYEISVRAAHPVTREIIGDATGRASRKEEVLEVATRLVARLRKALGDKTSDSAQLFAMRTISASSLEAVGHYAAAVEAQARGRYDEAHASYLKAAEVDPKFGITYQGLAVISRNLGRLQDADNYIKQALVHLDGMTEREQLSTRGYYYRITGDYEQCVKEYGVLVAQYPADTGGRNSRATCLAKLRKMDDARNEMQQAVKMLPKHVVYRGNLAMLAAYAGDFATAEREAEAIQPPTDLATQALAFAQLGQGLLREAEETYRRLGTLSARGASAAASGLGDLALYEGRFSDAVRIYDEGASVDMAANNPGGAAMKLTSLAYAHLARGQTAPAVAAAEKALERSNAIPIRFLAARIFAEAGAIARARTLAAELGAEMAAEPRVYGKIVEGQIALKTGSPRQAIEILNQANSVLDTWLGHFDLGRAYFAADMYLQADSEFDRCIQRRGEALSLLADDPTYGYFPIVYYYRGQVRQALKTAGFADSYREYLKIRAASKDDPLLPELRRHARQ